MAKDTDDGAVATGFRSTSLANSQNVASSATVVTLFAANTKRLAAKLKNDSNATLYVKLGSGASLTSYYEDVAPGGVWKLDVDGVIYNGLITGIWSAANGAARTTEQVMA